MPTPLWWKQFYAAERELLGERGLSALLERAPELSISNGQALLVPHTRLTQSGHLVAAATRAVVASGAERVVALGVLHGLDRNRREWRGIHGPQVLNDKGIWSDEFSLDNFEVLLERSAKWSGVRPPTLVKAYPFCTVTESMSPDDMPGFADLVSEITAGAALVATADMVHHGAGYGTPPQEQLARDSVPAMDYSRQAIQGQLSTLAARNYSGFLRECERAHSDFRDVGPVLRALLPPTVTFSIRDVRLVNYAAVLKTAEPTWVAAALATW